MCSLGNIPLFQENDVEESQILHFISQKDRLLKVNYLTIIQFFSFYFYKTGELARMPIILESQPNAGIKNTLQTRVCWLGSAVQLLETTTLPLELQGIDLQKGQKLLIVHCNATGINTSLLSNIQKKYLSIHIQLANGKAADVTSFAVS